MTVTYNGYGVPHDSRTMATECRITVTYNGYGVPHDSRTMATECRMTVTYNGYGVPHDCHVQWQILLNGHISGIQYSDKST